MASKASWVRVIDRLGRPVRSSSTRQVFDAVTSQPMRTEQRTIGLSIDGEEIARITPQGDQA